MKNDKDMKSNGGFETLFKFGLIGFGLSLLGSLAVTAGIIYVALHFLAKIW